MCTVSKLHSGLFTAVLEDAVTQLHIVGECQNKLQTHKTKQDMNTILLTKKYNIYGRSRKYETEMWDVNLKKLNSDYYKINKIIGDRKSCYKVLSDTYMELTLKRTYSSLIKYKRLKDDQTAHVAFLTEDKPRNTLVYRETAKQLRLQRSRIKAGLYDFETVKEAVWVRTKDAKLKQKVKERYVDHWQESREEQNQISIKKNEIGLSESITGYRKKYDEEQRIHYELELITNVQVKNTLAKLDAILIKYENDIDVMDVRIEKTHSNYEDQIIKRRELEQKLADRETALRDWLQFKKDHEKTRLRNIRCNQAAIVVQAWWRGLLVRLKLGPFKKKNTVSRKGNKKMYKF